jgi:N-acetylmuramoyl-L-alanine amidase
MPLFRLISVLVILLLAGVAAAASPRSAVTDIRIDVQGVTTSVVLDLSAPVEYRLFTLANPYRVVLDFPQLEFKVPANRVPAGRGVINALRWGLFTPGTSRLVFDVGGPVGVSRIERLPAAGGQPARLAIDLAPATAAQFDKTMKAGAVVSSPQMAAAIPGATPAAPAAPVRTGRPKANAKPIIVIDAGHGGIDPGTIGASGTLEKNITLATARQLRRQLEATGRYRVVMTRDSDIFVPLRDRIAIARAAHGDMFISLHADAYEATSLRGASIYTLSEDASDAEAAALAAKENKSDVIAGVDLSQENSTVSSILIDLAQRETKNRSVQFAGMLVGALKKDTPVLHNAHRFAGFVVLKAPDIPSVLIELGYLSSKDDEALLAAAGHRTKIAKDILRAVDGYFEWQAHLKRS